MNATPNLDAPVENMRPIEGDSPDPVNTPDGCSYHPRCPLADEQCRESEPPHHRVSDAHASACFHWDEAGEAVEFTLPERGER